MGADPRRQPARADGRALRQPASRAPQAPRAAPPRAVSPRDPRHALGQRAEDAAAAQLLAAGAEILLRNFRRRSGELDLVARLGNTLLIVEVRCRSRDDYGGAAASVHSTKQSRVVRTTLQLLQQRPEFARLPVRFDVIVATPRGADAAAGFDLEWIRHAFEAGR